MPIITDMTQPLEDRLEREREVRKVIKAIFLAALEDRWQTVLDLYLESREDQWFHVAVWSGLPNTLRQRIRDLEHDHDPRRVG